MSNLADILLKAADRVEAGWENDPRKEVMSTKDAKLCIGLAILKEAGIEVGGDYDTSWKGFVTGIKQVFENAPSAVVDAIFYIASTKTYSRRSPSMEIPEKLADFRATKEPWRACLKAIIAMNDHAFKTNTEAADFLRFLATTARPS